MNLFRGHSLLTEVLYDLSNFNFVHFPSFTPLPCLLRISTEIDNFRILYFLPKMLNKITLLTDWGFIFNLFIPRISGRELLSDRTL